MRVWRLLRLIWTTLTYTFATSWLARRKPEAEQDAFRARRQQVGTAKLCRILGLRISTEGALPEGGAMLAVSNHYGVLDPLIIASQMPLAIVANLGVRSWPVVGWVCRVMGIVFVDRSRRTQTADFVDEVQQKLRKGVRVLVFPEGTTSSEVLPRPFKTGAFEAVAEMPDGAVLPLYLRPVAVAGEAATGAVRQRLVWADAAPSFLAHGWQLLGLGRIDVVLHVGEPVPTKGLDRKQLARRTHAEVTALAEQAA